MFTHVQYFMKEQGGFFGWLAIDPGIELEYFGVNLPAVLLISISIGDF